MSTHRKIATTILVATLGASPAQSPAQNPIETGYITFSNANTLRRVLDEDKTVVDKYRTLEVLRQKLTSPGLLPTDIAFVRISWEPYQVYHTDPDEAMDSSKVFRLGSWSYKEKSETGLVITNISPELTSPVHTSTAVDHLAAECFVLAKLKDTATALEDARTRYLVLLDRFKSVPKDGSHPCAKL